MIKGIIFAIIFIILAIIILIGKGDFLIAGYNTASEEEKKKVNIHRLRILVTIVCVITAGLCYLMDFIGEDTIKTLPVVVIYIAVIIIFIILGNTWAKKK